MSKVNMLVSPWRRVKELVKNSFSTGNHHPRNLSQPNFALLCFMIQFNAAEVANLIRLFFLNMCQICTVSLGNVSPSPGSHSLPIESSLRIRSSRWNRASLLSQLFTEVTSQVLLMERNSCLAFFEEPNWSAFSI